MIIIYLVRKTLINKQTKNINKTIETTRAETPIAILSYDRERDM